jgi:phage terminase large subunit-like protein
MKAKLIKDEDGYSLFTREENSTNRKFIATTQGMYVDHKLSKQNCDEIFGVVDVIYKQVRNGFDGVIDSFTEAFAKECINKAMELYQPTEIEVEIEMEKVVDKTKVIGAVKGVKGSGDKITTYKSVPKLDENGCLILKRI